MENPGLIKSISDDEVLVSFFSGLEATQSYEDENHIRLKKKSRLRRIFRGIYSASLSLAPEGFLSSEKEQISPKKRNPKICIEDKDIMYDVGSPEDPNIMYDMGSPEDPTQTVPSVQLERCIQLCSLFLPDYEFERNKLLQLWIAEEYLEVEASQRMEDVAHLIFDNLVHEDVIIPSRFNHSYRPVKFKVNTSKFSARFQGNYFRSDQCNLYEMCGETLHLKCQWSRDDRSLVEALKNCKEKLHTLVVRENSGALFSKLPAEIFLGLKFLRTLDLSRTHISELPNSIGKLDSLRCLDVSETPIKRLPETTACLYFLQTLNLSSCFGLCELPRRLGRLINLRHLDLHIVAQLKSMPRGMGNLTKLQTLKGFLVGTNEGCGIGELKNMNDITGSFCIAMLENVVRAEEAKEAALADKRRIEKLDLRWYHGNEDSLDTSEILEYLQPHFHLKELQISNFSGSKLPSWMSNPSFTELASITLHNCINCHILPSIGELPSLRILCIIGMENVRDISTLFSRNHGVTEGFRAFPQLEKLTLENMLNLEEWTGVEDGDFPRLQRISITYCPKLYVLPSLSHLHSLQHLEVIRCMELLSLPEGLLPGSLEYLIIKDCPKLKERCLEDEGQDRFKIAHVKNTWIDFQKISLD